MKSFDIMFSWAEDNIYQNPECFVLDSLITESQLQHSLAKQNTSWEQNLSSTDGLNSCIAAEILTMIILHFLLLPSTCELVSFEETGCRLEKPPGSARSANKWAEIGRQQDLQWILG